MGLGSGGVWIGVTFATLAYWPGQEYLCMSRIYAAYSAGALLGPALGALGGTSTPLRHLRSPSRPRRPCRSSTPPTRHRRSPIRPDCPAHRSILGLSPGIILATGTLDGVLPLHFALHLSQTGIGLVYLAGPALGGPVAQYIGFAALGLLPAVAGAALLLIAGLSRRRHTTT